MTLNRLILIGNGFDLALGLKTSYSDFVLDYIKKCAIKCASAKQFSDNLITMYVKDGSGYYIRTGWQETLDKITDLNALIYEVQQYISVTFLNTFFKDIVLKIKAEKWVDIEAYYYSILKSTFNHQERLQASHNREKNFDGIATLNECMNQIADALETYIREQQEKHHIDYDTSHLSSLIDTFFTPLSKKEYDAIFPLPVTPEISRVTIVNFNYTNTANKILSNSSIPRNDHLHIHGTVNDPDNPIIFGYGDDTGEEYRKMEMEGNDDLLRKIKSFQYPRTYNYHKLLQFINSGKFDVFIVGHSCGLSDKTMLQTIFENDNCIAIKNFHYKESKEQALEEEFDKRMAISRHFSNKKIMRDRVLPFDVMAKIYQKSQS